MYSDQKLRSEDNGVSADGEDMINDQLQEFRQYFGRRCRCYAVVPKLPHLMSHDVDSETSNIVRVQSA